MDRKVFAALALSFVFASCNHGSGELPFITENDIQKAQDIESLMQEEIQKGDLIAALEEDPELQQKGFITGKLIKKLISAIMPDHLERFSKDHQGLSEEDETFAEYEGIYGRCYQFRVFYKYQDSRVSQVKWASSVLSIPSRDYKNVNAGVVLAPSLDGFTPFIENGLWLKLCRKGVATLTPESLYRDTEKGWEKVHFDPTPPYNSVEEYALYEESITRYEKILNMNLDILRNLSSVKTDRSAEMGDLEVMTVRPDRVGFWGSSFGAVVGALVVAKDPEVRAAVLTVGGGNLPYIISRSNIGLFKKTRKAQMNLLGLKTLDEYQDFISQHIESDPLTFAKESDAPRLHMIVASKDHSVPSRTQYELLEKFGTPSNSRIRSGHVLTLLLTSWFNLNSSRTAVNSLVDKLTHEEQ